MIFYNEELEYSHLLYSNSMNLDMILYFYIEVQILLIVKGSLFIF